MIGVKWNGKVFILFSKLMVYNLIGYLSSVLRFKNFLFFVVKIVNVNILLYI